MQSEYAEHTQVAIRRMVHEDAIERLVGRTPRGPGPRPGVREAAAYQASASSFRSGGRSRLSISVEPRPVDRPHAALLRPRRGTHGGPAPRAGPSLADAALGPQFADQRGRFSRSMRKASRSRGSRPLLARASRMAGKRSSARGSKTRSDGVGRDTSRKIPVTVLHAAAETRSTRLAERLRLLHVRTMPARRQQVPFGAEQPRRLLGRPGGDHVFLAVQHQRGQIRAARVAAGGRSHPGSTRLPAACARRPGMRVSFRTSVGSTKYGTTESSNSRRW